MQIPQASQLNKILVNRTTNKYLLTTNYEKYLSKELVPEKWYRRHIKLIKAIGVENYDALVYQAKKGRDPQKLLAWLVDKELKAIAEHE